MSEKFNIEPLSVRAGTERSQHGEHSDAVYLTSSFVFGSAAQAAERFANREPGHIYSRFTNPTVSAFEQRLAALEGAECCIATASGMSAILSCAMGLLKSGDHIVCSAQVFGATVQLFGGILKRFGVETTFVSGSAPAAWQKAVQPSTRLLFVETPSNPTMEIFDIAALAQIAKKAGALLAVDNVFYTPILQRPLELGADIVVHSATKYLDGQGRVLGGAELGKRAAIYDGVFGFLRTAGPTLSAFNAWVILKGLETLRVRIEAQSAAALELARWLERQPGIERVYYPGLASHPQYALAKKQQKGAGAIVSFDVKGGKDGAWRVVDSTQLLSITANLGDTRTTITHPASTTQGRITQEARNAAGIGDGLLRVAVGLESIEDIKADLARGLV